ncbi:MAG: hypothetical protein IH986_19140, partial [Planctomycetes bacterium]|nr:hypothetical protein [Planctomycetota bacterium]
MNLLGASFRIGSLFGVNIRIHILFVIWIAFQLFSDPNNWRGTGLFMAMLFGIILVHEFGHCFGARSVGGDARDIMLWPLGGLAFAQAPMRPWPQFVTVACGPLVNVVFCLISAVALFVGGGDYVSFHWHPLHGVGLHGPFPSWVYYVSVFYHVNYLLLAFNLLPIYPLDGGQLFQAIIWPFVGLQRATLLAVDAQMGVEGAPQSATGQAALLTGENVPELVGEHYGPKPNPAVAEIVRRDNLFKKVLARGGSAALLNGYPPRYFEAIK